MRPRDLFADVGDLYLVGVKPDRSSSFTEGGFVHRRGARSDDHTIQIVLADGLLNELLAGIGAHVLVIGGKGDAGIVAQCVGHLLHIDRAGDIESAVADKDADTGHSTAPPRPQRASVRKA